MTGQREYIVKHRKQQYGEHQDDICTTGPNDKKEGRPRAINEGLEKVYQGVQDIPQGYQSSKTSKMTRLTKQPALMSKRKGDLEQLS